MFPSVKNSNIIKAMSVDSINLVRRFEEVALEQPQINLEIIHTFHAGIYARTVLIPAGVLITGALIKIPTCLIVSGTVKVFTGEASHTLCGYNVLSAEAGRKQVFLALKDTTLTMMFATKAKTVEEAEAEFTDEFDMLQSNQTISRSLTCQEL